MLINDSSIFQLKVNNSHFSDRLSRDAYLYPNSVKLSSILMDPHVDGIRNFEFDWIVENFVIFVMKMKCKNEFEFTNRVWGVGI